MDRYRLIRWMMRGVTLPFRLYGSGEAPIQVPEKFLFFRSHPPNEFLWPLARVYQEIFSKPPWNERWQLKDVFDKLARELNGESFLVLMRGDEEWPVAGFSWGALLPIEALEERIERSLGERPVGLEAILRDRGVDKVLYFDEFAILRRFRGGLDPLRFLLRLGLELGRAKGVRQTIFWSTPESKIVPLSLYMGYEPIYSLVAEGKEIVFLYNRNFLPLLKVVQNLKWRPIARFMGWAARILGRKRRKAGT